MPVEQFTREQFESVLPKHKVTGKPLWIYSGMQQGEHTYKIPVSDYAGILVRSSVGVNGTSADCGEDSIRGWIINPDGMPLGSKTQRWVTRVKGWDGRLIVMLRKLWRMARYCKPCPICGKTLRVYKTRSGVNAGRLFAGCAKECKQFQWIEEE